ncbi:unnamed protein product [Microthlaspi erraticum]|uniref:Uncharacterized protein n=1 Tax=Microthlaspi erraticum TaxID=1685480 RepID=A0A6D2K3J0_9BRAS|nr:unnamed protein product [Microthlaspi erraticum]CAA7046817.1 unnamed protein product [Microthlaspi erraticum]CAA7057235.1 unnamed protein product [Microthlaspi erraticum]
MNQAVLKETRKCSENMILKPGPECPLPPRNDAMRKEDAECGSLMSDKSRTYHFSGQRRVGERDISVRMCSRLLSSAALSPPPAHVNIYFFLLYCDSAFVVCILLM